MARRRSPLKKALHAMRPDRVLFRAFSGPEIVSALRTSTKTTAKSRQRQVATGRVKATGAAKKTTKRDPYADALKIPAANRQAAAKQAQARKQPVKKSVAVRRKDGTFNGRKAMDPRELAMFEAAEQRTVDPALLPRTPRRRRAN